MMRKRCGEGSLLICSGGKFHIKSLICIHMNVHVFKFILIVIVQVIEVKDQKKKFMCYSRNLGQAKFSVIGEVFLFGFHD